MLKKLNITSRKRKGGDTSTSSTIPDWAIPYIQNVGNQGEQLYTQGLTGQTAGTNPLLQAASGSGAHAIADTTNEGIDRNRNQQDVLDRAKIGTGEAFTRLNDMYGAIRDQAGVLGSTQGRLNDVYGAVTQQTGVLGAQQERLASAAQNGGYDTSALKDAAILDAGMRTAALGNQYGSMGTLGSARQGVQQGAQNAMTAAQFAKIDYDANQQNYQNKMAAEQGIGQSVQGMGNLGQIFNQTAQTQNQLGQGLGSMGQLYNQTAGQQGQLALGAGSLAQTSAGISAANQNLATNAAQAFSNLGAQQRSIEQENLDTPWTSLQRYASTIYGNPARQQTIAEGGK